MNKLKSLALLALAAFGLSVHGATTTNEWWSVTLDNDFQAGFVLEGEGLGSLTNDLGKMDNVVQPYASGVWSMIDGDESYVTNGLATNWVNNTMTEVSDTTYIKLDTQGNDLTWTPETNSIPDNIVALVDADLLLVGSDSPPDSSDFDASGDVHTAIYLKNEIEEESGDTTNSVLCVYVYNSDTGVREWQELDGVELEDNAWAHVQVVVNYADAANPMVQVFVNGTKMHARGDAEADEWTAAIKGSSQDAFKLSSVAFRGTGAVDNFVGETQVVSYDRAFFKAEVYLDNDTLLEELCQVTSEQLDIGGATPASFTQFLWEEYDDVKDCAIYGLDRVEITNFVNNRTQTYSFDYDAANGTIDPMPDEGPVSFYGDGFFRVTADTAGAPAPATEGEIVTNTIVKIYFKTAGAFDAYATTKVGDTTTTNAVTLKPVDLGGVYPTNLVWTFDAVQGDTILTNLVLSNGATLDGYANGKATVKVTVAEALAADTLYAAASYVAGALAANQDLRPTTNGNEIVFAPYTPPVAMIGTTEYPSLRAAVEAATAGDTIKLVHDDHVSFTAEAPELMIDKAITIDGGSNTLYGVSGHACATIEDRHNLAISGTGDVTIKDLTMTQFSDTATVQYYTYPIWVRGAYGGTLTLDGVTITDFSRTAVNISGGAVVITNCVFTGDTTRLDANGHAFQGGVEVGNGLDALVTIADTTITGMGSVGYPTDSDSDMAAAVQMSGKGSITIENGTFAGQYSLIVSATATGGIVVNGGDYDGDVCVENGAGTLAIHGGSVNGDIEVASELAAFIDGGWFKEAPVATYIAAGYKASADPANAPRDATQFKVAPDAVTYLITFMNGETKFWETNVLADATGYGPATDPAPAEGFEFGGWTNAVAGGAAVATADLPAADGDATWTAVFTEQQAVEVKVDAGDGLAAYNAAHADDPGFTPVEPIAFSDAATPLCEISFVAPEAGTYVLLSSTTVDGTYNPETGADASKTVTQGAVVTLTEGSASATGAKFFKIGYEQ